MLNMAQWSAVLVMILYHTAILLHDISITMFFNSISMFISVAAIHLHFDTYRYLLLKILRVVLASLFISKKK